MIFQIKSHVINFIFFAHFFDFSIPSMVKLTNSFHPVGDANALQHQPKHKKA